MCVNYRELNKVICKDHFPLPFLDQIDRLSGFEYYYFLDGYSGYNQIMISPKDQRKPLLLVYMTHLHKGEYLLAFVMHRLLLRDE